MTMGFLAPLYIAAAAAISLPIILHLIRRMPRGRFPFSSLMFLSPSPPRLARRNRLENKLLLFLRALALVLIALAFARPFFRERADRAAGASTVRRIAILLDTSASMRRSGLWPAAIARVESILDDLSPGDDAALYTFDSGVRIRAAFQDVVPQDPAPRRSEMRAIARAVEPSWAGTDLGTALVTAADALNDLPGAREDQAGAIRTIALVSDLAEGSRIDALRAYEWPPDVGVEIAAVRGADPNNAGVERAAPAEGEDEADAGVRVAVTNDRESRAGQFSLRWEGPKGAIADLPPVPVHVPPGERRIVRVPSPPDGAQVDRIVLDGDAHVFDNTLYRAPIVPIEIQVPYAGEDAADDVEGLRYYIERAFPDTPRRHVRVVALAAGDIDLRRAPLIVAGGPIGADLVEPVRTFVRDGGTLLFVLRDAGARDSLRAITGRDAIEIEEVKPGDYAMLGEIAFGHPVFASFADPRYSDFTKIRFWRYRRLSGFGAGGFEILARFESGDPAFIEAAQGKGRVLILTSGWHPADSQLARSTKFVPLLSAVLERAGGASAIAEEYRAGDALPAPADAPGIYRVRAGETDPYFAVNVDPAESRTAPLAVEELERHGLRIGGPATRAEIEERRRQMLDVELEGRQKSWRWLIAAALGGLIVETVLAGFLARRRAREIGATT